MKSKKLKEIKSIINECNFRLDKNAEIRKEKPSTEINKNDVICLRRLLKVRWLYIKAIKRHYKRLSSK